MAEQRYAAVAISVELLCEIVKEGWHIPNNARQYIKVTRGVPQDAHFIAARYNPARPSEVQLVFEHPSFLPVTDLNRLPEINVLLESHEVSHEPTG